MIERSVCDVAAVVIATVARRLAGETELLETQLWYCLVNDGHRTMVNQLALVLDSWRASVVLDLLV